MGVIPKPGNKCFGDAEGAYVNVITFATSAESFRRRVKRALDEIDITLTELEDVEPFPRKFSNMHADEELLQIAETATRMDSVAFGTFYTYFGDDKE